jgi:hypothetical protein
MLVTPKFLRVYFSTDKDIPHTTQGFMLVKQGLYRFSHMSSPLCSGYFGDRVSHSVCLGWPQPTVLLISASQVTRITGVRHRSLAHHVSFVPPGLPSCMTLTIWMMTRQSYFRMLVNFGASDNISYGQAM